MARKILVSRVGLTRCPSCGAHIRVADELRETECPFCQATLVSRAPGRGPLARALSAGRSGLLAASLLGAASVGAIGCVEEDDPEPTADAAMDSTPEALYGAVPDDMTDDSAQMDVQPDAAEDSTIVALYGISPADASDADSIEQDSAADTFPEAMYGIVPADMIDDDVDATDAEDSIDQPLYGISPDAG